MKIKRPEIILDSVQFKSLDACKKVAKGVELIEQYGGIYSCKITIIKPFICPDIDLLLLTKTPTEKIEKYKLKNEGVTKNTWDREKAGYRLKR